MKQKPIALATNECSPSHALREMCVKCDEHFLTLIAPQQRQVIAQCIQRNHAAAALINALVPLGANDSHSNAAVILHVAKQAVLTFRSLPKYFGANDVRTYQ